MIRRFKKQWPSILMLASTILLPNITFASLTSTNTKILTFENSKLSQDETSVFMSNLSPDGTANVQVSSDNTTIKRLLLMNNPILNKGVKNKPAQVTVIHNTSTKPLSIREIEVLGPPSDVVIASPSGLICDSCSFKNTKRVLLTTGSPHFTHGNLTSIKTQQGLLEIVGAGLKTQDAIFVDLLADKMNINAEINTFTRVNKNSAGQYDIAPDTGKLLASQGNLQLITGHTSMDYQTANVTINDANQSDRSLQINSAIYSGSVFIQTTSLYTNVHLNGDIFTSADISLADTYQEKNVIPSGNINIKSFGTLNIGDSKLKTKSNTYLESSEIKIAPIENYKDYSIQSGNIEIAAEKSFFLSGLLFADNIKIAANSVKNKGGELFARDSLYVNGNKYIENNHQGLLVGNNVALHSENTIINGIVKPWQCVSASSSNRNFHVKSKQIEIGTGVGLIKDFLNGCNADSVVVNWGLEERKSSILGFNLSLSAPEIINSNPYIKKRGDHNKPEISMSVSDSNVVSISAENALVIKASNAFKNGSGVVEVLNGNISIDSPKINNQRYYIKGETAQFTRNLVMTEQCKKLEKDLKSKYKYDFSNVHNWLMAIMSRIAWDHSAGIFVQKIRKTYIEPCSVYVKGMGNHKITETITKQYVSVLSPISRILVSGNFIVNSKNIYNEASNVEIWGEMIGKLSEIKSLGLALNEKIVRTTVTYHTRNYCSRRVLGACIKRKTKRWTTTSDKLIKDETTGQFPALFEINKANIHVANGKVTTGNITFGN